MTFVVIISTSGAMLRDTETEGMAEDGGIGGTAPSIFVDEPVHKPRQMRVICIGAGLSGIAAAYKYQERLKTNASFVIYEKNNDVTGTWLENRYPGCACDIPAHGYTYSWEGNPEWSRL